MAIKSKFRHWTNKWLALANLRIETRTAKRAEMDRLLNKYFDHVQEVLVSAVTVQNSWEPRARQSCRSCVDCRVDTPAQRLIQR